MLTVGLIAHSPASANLGVGALTISEIEILRSIARRLGTELNIQILDWTLPQASYAEGDDIEIREMTGRTLIAPQGYLRMVRACDLVIDIGAGDSFADIYGPKRLMRMFCMKYLVHLAGRPLVLAPQTYGPFQKPLSIRLSRGTLRRTALIASRDRMSTDAVGQLLPGAEVIEASDVALRLPYTPPDTAGASASDKGEAPIRVGLNVSGLLMNGGYTRQNMFGLTLDYPSMIRTLVGRFLSHPAGCELHLVPHVIPTKRGMIEDDLQPSLDLQAEFPQIKVAPAFRTPSEAKSYIAGMDFFAGARMHACIAAFSTGVPVVPMAYSRKFEGLFGTLGYNHTVDCTAEDAETIIDKVIGGFEARDTLAQDMRPALQLGLEKLARYEEKLEEIMGQRLAK